MWARWRRAVPWAWAMCHTMRFIIIPQAIKNILPALGNEFITLFKDTSLVTTIGLHGADSTAAQAIGGTTYQTYMFPYVGIAVIYLVMVIIFTWLHGHAGKEAASQ